MAGRDQSRTRGMEGGWAKGTYQAQNLCTISAQGWPVPNDPRVAGLHLSR